MDHWCRTIAIRSQTNKRGVIREYLDLADTAGIAGLAQSGLAGVHGDDDAMAIPCSSHDRYTEAEQGEWQESHSRRKEEVVVTAELGMRLKGSRVSPESFWFSGGGIAEVTLISA